MPANTPRDALPYPLPTEPVAEGAQAIRNLAERLDALASAVSVWQASGPNIPDLTWTPITFTGEVYDPDNMHAANDSKLVAAIEGVYLAVGTVTFAQAAGQSRFLRIRLNDASLISIINNDPLTGDTTSMTITGLAVLAAGHFLRMEAFHNAGIVLNVVNTNFGMVRVG